MKKLLVEDIYKAVMSDRDKEIARIMVEFDVNEDEATYLYDNFRTDPERADVVETAFLLDTDIENIEDDDVEFVMHGPGNRGELDSDSGVIKYYYDRVLKAYIVYMLLSSSSNPKDQTEVLYRLDPEMMADWQESDSKGIYYNTYIRGNTAIEDPSISCGCGPNPCEPSQIDQFNQQFNSQNS